MDPDSFERDPEGQGVAAAINAHLPPEVGGTRWGVWLAGGRRRGSLQGGRAVLRLPLPFFIDW